MMKSARSAELFIRRITSDRHLETNLFPFKDLGLTGGANHVGLGDDPQNSAHEQIRSASLDVTDVIGFCAFSYKCARDV